MRRHIPLALALILTLAWGVSAQNTIVQIAAATPQFSALVQSIIAAELVEALGAGSLTVFAPTNKAFLQTARDLGFEGDDFEDAVVAIVDFFTIGNPPISLRDVILYHALNTTLNSTQVLASDTLTTLQGGLLSVDAAGPSLGDAAPQLIDPNIIDTDIQASNGVIHAIDRVLIPIDIDSATAPLAPENRPSPTGDEMPLIAEESPEESLLEGSPETTDGTGSDDDDPICFPASALVHTADSNDVQITRLHAGHHILVSEGGSTSPVFFFSHRVSSGTYEFLRITSDKRHAIILSASHYLYANGILTPAEKVNVGDILRTLDGPAKVIAVDGVREQGLFAPHTMHGDIVVNRVVASTYTTAIHPRLAHILLAPVRAVVHMGIAKEPLGSLLYNGVPRLRRVSV